MSNPARVKTVTIAINTALSTVLNTQEMEIAAILMPAAWDAANLTFQACATENGTFLDVYDAAAGEVTIQAAASRALVFSTDASVRMLAFPFLKIRSGTTGAPVNQTAARTLTIVLKGD